MAEPSYPAASKYHDGVASGYDERRRSHPTWRWEDDHVRRFVASLPGRIEVLDVPVGTGRYVPIFLEAGWSVHGCDISADMLTAAEQQLGDDFARCHMITAPAEAMPLDDASIDVIVSGRFIQWLPDLEAVDRVIAELARVGRGELFLQLRIPARPRESPGVGRSLRYVAAALRRLVRGWTVGRAARHTSLTAHPEPALLAILHRHGWHLVSISEECPSDPGLRWYRLQRPVTGRGRG
jgi:ubiquinone/menaquinone biosynthesis C-methylase UbiE